MSIDAKADSPITLFLTGDLRKSLISDDVITDDLFA